VEILQRVAAAVFIVAPDADRFADLGLPVHPDLVPGAGAMGGLHTALEMSPADRVIVVPCDMPFLHEGLLGRLVELAGEADGAWVRTAHGVEPLLACYQRATRAAVKEAIDAGRLKLADLACVLRMREMDAAAVAAFGPADELLANVNDPADYGKVE
jgi:molybdopterin-guanine dinucleotide biosynthesis protein A